MSRVFPHDERELMRSRARAGNGKGSVTLSGRGEAFLTSRFLSTMFHAVWEILESL